MEETADDAGYPTTSSDEGGDMKAPEPAPPAWMVPTRRGDHIGALAWQLVGSDGGMPDFSAAAPLADAIQEEDPEGAQQFRRKIAQLVSDLPGVGERRNQLRQWLRGIRRKTIESASHLLYDFNSAAGVLARAVEFASAPAPALVEEMATVRTVLVDVGYRSVGETLRMADGRRITVIEPTNEAGMTRVMLNQPGGG